MSSFFSTNYSCVYININNENFNEMLTNKVFSFKQLTQVMLLQMFLLILIYEALIHLLHM